MHHVPHFPERSTAGPPGRCDVRVRLMVALAAILAVVISTRLWFGLAVLGCCLAGFVATRVSPRGFGLYPPNIAPTLLLVTKAVCILSKLQIYTRVSPVTRFNWSSHDTG